MIGIYTAFNRTARIVVERMSSATFSNALSFFYFDDERLMFLRRRCLRYNDGDLGIDRRTRRFTAKNFLLEHDHVMTAMIGIIAMRMSASFQLTNSMMTTQPSTYMEPKKYPQGSTPNRADLAGIAH